MKKQYMNYGSIQNANQYTSVTSLKQVDYSKKGQVYQLTHEGEGESLSFMDKAFISFTYGGRKIEDFNLIAVTVNDRLQRENPPSHQDYVTQYKMLNGQYYWGSHYNAREMSITLATDGMTQQQLDEFKYWFQPGEIKELILSEHPNRGILARIAEMPQISMLPFKTKVRQNINGEIFYNTVIEYKGNILLNFIMDEPFWYAINNVLGDIYTDENGYTYIINKEITPESNNDTSINNSVTDLNDDNIKIVIEDHIPTGDMFSTEINLGDNIKITPITKYKYTLTNEKIEAKENGILVGGTPVVNEIDETTGREITTYPESGAITGPLYTKSFNPNEHLTSLNMVEVRQYQRIALSTELNSGLIIQSEYQDEYVLTRYLPAKMGSTFTLISAYPESRAYIILYDKNSKQFIREEYLYDDIKEYKLDKDYYVRLYVSVFNFRDRKNHPQLNETYDINNIIGIDVITFNEQVNIIQGALFKDNITAIQSDWIAIGEKIDLFNGKDIQKIDSEQQAKMPYIAMLEYLPVRSGSIIKKAENLSAMNYLERFEGFIYDLKDKSFIQNFFVNEPYIINQDCYIRFNVVFKSGITPNINLINTILDLNLQIINDNTSLYYYYAGNAPSNPELSFSVPLHFNNEGYIDTFFNEIYKSQEGNSYNTLCLESENKHELKLTSPSIITAYNYVISKLLSEETTNMAIPLAIQAFRLEVGHPIIRNWIINCINIYQHTYNSQENINDSNKLLTLTSDMKHMLLLYMPYVFSNYSNINLPEYEGEPIEVYAPKEITVDYDNATKRIINEDEGTIRVILGEPLSIALQTTNALYYQWQFSIDDGISWYVMSDQGAWSGSNTATLRCLKDSIASHTGIGLDDIDKCYRCLVSNNTAASKYSDIIKLEKEDKKLTFVSCPSDAVTYDFGEKVTLEWKAKNYKSGETKILYHSPSNLTWSELTDNDLVDLMTERTLSDLGGKIHFEFKINHADLNGYWFSVQIENDYHNAENPINPLNAVDNTDGINYQNGTLLNVDNVLSTNNSTITIGYRNYGSTDAYTEFPYNQSHQIIAGKEIKLSINNIFYSDTDNSYFEVLPPNSSTWINVSSTSGGFNTEHVVFPSYTYGIYSIIWTAKLIDNNYTFRFNARGVNDQQIYLPSAQGFKINKVVSQSEALIDPIYTITETRQYMGDNFSISVQDNNQGSVTYSWWYKATSSDNWTQVIADNIVTGVNTNTLTFTNVTIEKAGFYKITLTKGGQTYNDNSKYIHVKIYNKMIITTDLSGSSVTNIPYYNYQLKQLYNLNLSCAASYADDCQWIYKINNYQQEIINGVTKTTSNHVLTTTLNTSIFSYEQLAQGIQIYCKFINNTSNDTLTSNTIMTSAVEQNLPSVTIEPQYNTSWNWKWPLDYIELYFGGGGTIVTHSAMTAPVECNCQYTSNQVFSFSGVAPTKSPEFDSDKVPLADSYDGHVIPGKVITELRDIYAENVNFAIFQPIATIKVHDSTQNLQWETIILNTSQVISDSIRFGIDMKIKYYTDSTFSHEQTFTMTSAGVTIFSPRTTNYSRITYMEICVQPFFKQTWNKVDDLSCEYSRYYQGRIGYKTKIYRERWILEDLINLSGTNIKIQATGIPVTTRNKLMATRILKAASNNRSNILTQDVHFSFNYYHPVYPNKFLQGVTVVNAAEFLQAMNNTGQNYTYKFIYDERENYWTGGWNYDGMFYQVNPPGLEISYWMGPYEITTPLIEDDDGNIISDTIVDAQQKIICPSGVVLEVKVEFTNIGEQVVDQDLLVNINCETGQYNVSFNYNQIKWPGALLDNLTQPQRICDLSSLRNKESYTATEEAGDMILYNNFMFNEQNCFDSATGTLKPWSETNKKLSYKITYDGKIPLYHFDMNYKNYYL